MKISEIYEKYNIMPLLELHMLRVAGVAKIICDDIQIKVDEDTIIKSCLFHDMGNIVKANLKNFAENLKKNNIKYWESIKQETISKYGSNDHNATINICKEIGISNGQISLISKVGFSKEDLIAELDDFNIKILSYSDLRVSPFGVVSLDERLEEGIKRYSNQNENNGLKQKKLNELISSAHLIEKQIFSYCKIKPSDITNEKVTPLIAKLKSIEII